MTFQLTNISVEEELYRVKLYQAAAKRWGITYDKLYGTLTSKAYQECIEPYDAGTEVPVAKLSTIIGNRNLWKYLYRYKKLGIVEKIDDKYVIKEKLL